MIRRGALTVATLSLLLALSACGDDTDGADADGSASTETVEIALEAGEVTPNGDRIEVAVDQPVDLVITADEPGELHVHSTPEQTVEFDAGENDPVELQFDRPGLVEIELHEPVEEPVVELQVQ